MSNRSRKYLFLHGESLAYDEFRWKDCCDHGYDMVPISRDQQFVAAIKNIKGLRKLHLQFPNIFLEPGVNGYKLYVPLTGILSLTSLEL
jgi:hypothetical protein